ncbi:MAG: YebC/PmpR family DNA-binding transcriptional regulator [Bacteroidales bacterium]|jgi:YebC/PmpR family DNA-binding regulatory protein|nr:YebC/PmpR family DNA-binding transcriptional regulator [Bacteroidales bacterium]
MGRAFEYRKARKMKRWGSMSKTFTKLGKEITMAVKASGPDPNNNPKLRVLIQNARAANMPKDNIERAIIKATSKDQADYKEITYEGYAPHGIAILVEAATDNNTRTVANVRSYFNKCNGSLGVTGCVDFMFERQCHFKIAKKENVDMEGLELELIEYGVEELFEEDDRWILYANFEAFGPIQKFLEDNGFEIVSAEFDRIPMNTKLLMPEQQTDVEKLLERLEEDEDVSNVYHNMQFAE